MNLQFEEYSFGVLFEHVFAQAGREFYSCSQRVVQHVCKFSSISDFVSTY